MQQRGRVEKLDDRREPDVVRGVVAAAARGQQDDQRAQALAAAVDDIGTDLLHQADLGRQLRGDEGVDLREVAGGEPIDGCEVGCVEAWRAGDCRI